MVLGFFCILIMRVIENNILLMYNNDNDNERKIHPEVRMKKVETHKGKRWNVAVTQEAIETKLTSGLSVHPIVSHLLANRGITTVEAGQTFLYSTMDDLLDPFTLKGMREAVEEIERVLASNGSIVIYGDYDVDGITATSLMYRFFSRLGANVSYYIPERQSEGYGLNLEALEYLIQEKTDLIISVDCGISSYDIVEAVRDRVSMIITDHHTAPPQIPRATAVVNHKQPDCPYEDKNLSGVGVAFKVCQALWKRRTGEEYGDDLDIVALGTVADVVPLVGENRIIVREGLRKMTESPNLGIQALIEVAGLTGKAISAGHIGFTLAPRLNAAGRVTHATRAVELLITASSQEAMEIAEELQETNAERQQIERAIFEEAYQAVLAQGTLAEQCIVVAGEGWHPGVIGIVASRLVEAFYKPTMVISIHDGIGKGSCRSIDNCNIYDVLCSAKDVLIQFGGHSQAAGFSVDADQIDALRDRASAYCREHLVDTDYIPIIDIDGIVSSEDISIDLIDQIATLEPYGMGNSTPVFAIPDIAVQNLYPMGFQKNHCKIVLQGQQGPVDAVAWQGEHYMQEIFADDPVKIAFTLQKNEWQGTVRPQLIVQDMSPLQEQREQLTVEGLRKMYVVVKNVFRSPTAPKYIVEREALEGKPCEMTPREAMLSLEVFKELGILQEEVIEDGRHVYRWMQVKQKLELHTSLTFMNYSQEGS